METTSINPKIMSLEYLHGLTKDINKIVRRSSYDDAVLIYTRAKEKLLDVNSWKHNPRLKEFGYLLADGLGNPKLGKAQEGDLIRFKNTAKGDTFCWVLVDRILEVKQDEWTSFAMKLAVVSGPFTDQIPGVENVKTDTLIIERTGKKVVAYVHQRVNQKNDNKVSRFMVDVLNVFRIPLGETSHKPVWENIMDNILE